MRLIINWLVIGISILISCNNVDNELHTSNNFRLPLDNKNVWYYDVRIFKQKGFVDGTDFNRDIDHDFELIRDTITITIDSIVTNNNLKIFFLSKELNNLWYKNIAIQKDGYINYYFNSDNMGSIEEYDYIIKFPIKLELNWEHHITEGILRYRYTNVDTSIIVNSQPFNNCIELTAELKYNYCEARIIKIYFNEKYGLVYYNDPLLEEEIKLIKMDTFPNK